MLTAVHCRAPKEKSVWFEMLQQARTELGETKMTDNVHIAGGTAGLSLSDSKYMKFTLCDWFSLKH